MNVYKVKTFSDRTEWYYDGKAHRESGPAKEYSDGSKEYALNGRFMTEEEWKAQKKL